MNLNIGTRIVAAFAVVLSVMGALCIYQFGSMSSLSENSTEILDADMRAVKLQGEIASAQNDMHSYAERALNLYFLEKNGLTEARSKGAQQEWELAGRNAEMRFDELIALADSRAQNARVAQNAELWKALGEDAVAAKEKMNDISAIVLNIFGSLNRGEISELSTQIIVLDRQRALFSGAMDQLSAYTDEMDVVAKRAIDSIYQDVLRVFTIAIVVAVAIAFGSVWILHRSIAPPLNELVAFVERVGHGDLTKRLNKRGKDEIGRLSAQIDGMVDSLADSTRQTLEAVANVANATAQLQSSVSQQAASTNEQNSAVQEISTTLSEVAQSGKQISERAKEVAVSSEATSNASQSGIDAAGEAFHSIVQIGEQAEAVAENIVALTEKTRSVGDIITTVNDIAERSNLLALNAAIEASAAGEHGQSFTVVADEMKNLATQAKEATAQVQAILGDIQQGINTSAMQTEEAVKRSEVGKRQSEKMRAAVENLVESIETNIKTFEQIIAATNQQQIGIEQVTQAIGDIRSSSAQVAEGTRGLEGATSNLNALSQQLKKSVERYAVS